MDAGESSLVASANDPHLVQLVRGALGRNPRVRSRINVSSCSSVVTLHGRAASAEERWEIEALVRRVPGVEGVMDKLGIS